MKLGLVLSILFVFQFSSAEFVELSQGPTYYAKRYSAHGGKSFGNVILLHGGKFSSWSMSAFVGRLADHGFNAVRYDFYGMGRSQRLRVDHYDRAIYLQQLTELIEHLGWHNSSKPLYLVGLEMGASIASMYSIRNPHSVAKIVMIGPAVDVKGTRSWDERLFVRAMRELPNSEFLREILEGKVVEGVDEFVSKLSASEAAFVRARFKKLRAGDYVEMLYRRLIGDGYNSYDMTYRMLGSLGIPTKIFYGALDHGFPASDMERMKTWYLKPQFLESHTYETMGSELTTVLGRELAKEISQYLKK